MADGIRGLESVVARKFPGAALQRCVTHLKRGILTRVRQGDRGEVSAEPRGGFATGQRGHTAETAWKNWQAMRCRREKRHGLFKRLRSDPDYKAYMTHLNFAPEIQRMVYTTNWIERPGRDFRRVLRMRTAMPSGESVITLIGSVAMNRRAFDRLLPNITSDGKLFPKELGREFGEGI